MDTYYIKRTHNQKGLFANKTIQKGSIIINFKGEISDQPHRLSIQIGDNKHIYGHDYETQYLMNHHCSPNAYINTETLQFIALKDIKKEEELTFNYNSTELKISHPFKCWCDSNNCVKEIKGFTFLNPDQIKKMEQSLIAPFLPLSISI